MHIGSGAVFATDNWSAVKIRLKFFPDQNSYKWQFILSNFALILLFFVTPISRSYSIFCI